MMTAASCASVLELWSMLPKLTAGPVYDGYVALYALDTAMQTACDL